MNYNDLINKIIITDDCNKYIDFIVFNNPDCILVTKDKANNSITYKEISKDYSNFLSIIKNKHVILTDIEILYKYDKSITRFFVNVASKETKLKTVICKKLMTDNIYDIFSYMFFLNKKILDVNNYWCFKANHYEINIFTGEPIQMLDPKYIANKLKNHVILDKLPSNILEAYLNEIIFT